ncbi:hypothetical protein ACA910_007274 [Epithemia clementina (nom. ined.)]
MLHDMNSFQRLSLRRKSSVESSEEIMEALTTAMNTFPHEERVQLSCLKVMRHTLPATIREGILSLDNDSRKFVVSPQHSTYRKNTQGQGQNDKTIDSVVSLESLVELILRAMQTCSGSTPVQMLSVTILHDLCDSTSMDGPRVLDAIINAGGLIRLSETMTFHRRFPVAKAASGLHHKLSQYIQVLESISTISLTSSKDSLDDTITPIGECKDDY